MTKKSIENIDLENKKVLVRMDFNVPIIDGKITADNRIKAAKDTVEYLITKNAKVILMSHLGRIKTEEDKVGKSLEPIAKRLSKIIGKEVIFCQATRGEQLEWAIDALQPGEVLLMENTRFEDVNGQKESKNDPKLGKYWASLADVFVNDAFGTTHRAHASNDGIATYINDSCVGYIVKKELAMLSRGLDNPKTPFVAIVGGAKVSDKIDVIDNMLKKADKIIIGGGMAFTFAKAKGYNIGNSILEEDKVEMAKQYLEKAEGKIVLPIDVALAPGYVDEKPVYANIDSIPDNMMGLDIGPKTIELFKEVLDKAKTVVWNGPMGVFEFKNYATGTIEVCKAIASLKDAFTIIGGGDSAAAAIQNGFEDDFSHISTGGGASLNYMEGKELIGISKIK